MSTMQKVTNESTIYDKMCAVLPHIIARFVSTAPNAKYTPQDVLRVSMSLCQHSETVAPTIRKMDRRDMDVMTGQRFLQILGAVPIKDMQGICHDMLETSVKAVAETGRLSGNLTIGVDDHLIPRFDKKGKEHPDLKSGKRKRGTNIFEGYMTAQVVSGKRRATLAAYPIVNGGNQTQFLGGIISNVRYVGADIGTMLLDRGFNSVDNMLEMERQNVEYIMPLKGNKKLYKIMEEVDAGTGAAVRDYTMINKEGKSATFTLVVCHKQKSGKSGHISDRYIAFATNIAVDNPQSLLRRIPKAYRARWGIETGYRVLETVRARTKSPRTVARLFLFYFSLVFANYWVLYKIILIIYVRGSTANIPMSDYADLLWLYIKGTYKSP